MTAVTVETSVMLDPQQLAALFWELDAEQHAEFFAALDDLAGLRLCYQMAAVVQEIQKRSDAGDYRAMNGFRTMLAHAQDYHEAATDGRVWDAKRAIDRTVAK